MDLKIRDVSELLNVSETTVRRWLKDGKIPAYQLNHQYRFSRNEIEDWMMKCKLETNGFSPFGEKQNSSVEEKEASSQQKGGMQQFSLYRAMNKGGVFVDLAGKTKEQIIKNTMQKAAPRLGLDPDVMTELLLDREALMSTALNHGIALPHPRDAVLKTPGSDVVITVFPQSPIEYGALDGSPVHTLFFLFSSSDKTHLHLLSKIAHLTSQESSLNFFETKPNAEALLGMIKNWESKIRQ